MSQNPIAPPPVQGAMTDTQGNLAIPWTQWFTQNLSSRVNTSLVSVTLSGDVTGAGGPAVPTTIAPGAVTLPKLAPVAGLIGTPSSTAATPSALSASQVTTFMCSISGGGTAKYLRADGSWNVPPAAGPASGDLAGTYPAPTVAGLEGSALPALAAGYLQWTGSAWAFGAGGTGLVNPMTTSQDLIVGGAAGSPTRLGVGANGSVLGVTAGIVGWVAAGTGSVTTVSVATANGFQGSVATPTSTPVITLQTSVSGMLKGSGNALVAATAGTDYQTPYAILSTLGGLSSSAGWLYNNGSGTLSYSTPTAAQVGALASGAQAVDSAKLNGQLPAYYQVAYAVLGTFGALANSAGYLYNNGSGVLSYATPAAASWPVSGTPANISTLGSLANAAGWLYNNGSGVYTYSTPTAANVGAEPALGNPGTTGYVLSSTTGGVRSWVAQPTVPAFYSSIPIMDSSAGAAGSSGQISQGDHVHPTNWGLHSALRNNLLCLL